MVSEAGAFLLVGGLEHHFQEKTSVVVPYVLRLIAISPKPGWFEAAVKVRQHEAMEASGINGRQGTPWSETLNGKELHRVTWWRVRSGVNPAFPSIYKCGLMLFLT